MFVAQALSLLSERNRWLAKRRLEATRRRLASLRQQHAVPYHAAWLSLQGQHSTVWHGTARVHTAIFAIHAMPEPCWVARVNTVLEYTNHYAMAACTHTTCRQNTVHQVIFGRSRSQFIKAVVLHCVRVRVASWILMVRARNNEIYSGIGDLEPLRTETMLELKATRCIVYVSR